MPDERATFGQTIAAYDMAVVPRENYFGGPYIVSQCWISEMACLNRERISYTQSIQISVVKDE